jgi:hypothetical protein
MGCVGPWGSERVLIWSLWIYGSVLRLICDVVPYVYYRGLQIGVSGPSLWPL